MKYFIVHCHPEPQSFNNALTDAAKTALEQAGHQVKISDLWQMGWDPYNDRRNFKTVADARYYRQQVEEAYASKHNGFSEDIKAEHQKLEWCDVLIFQFPLHWFGFPAMAKSWVDKVFAYQTVYGGNAGWYDKSKFSGKRAMLSVTTGGPASMYGLEGLNGHIEVVLFPINHGVLFFAGFTPVEPFVCYSVARVDDKERKAMLESYKQRVLTIPISPPLPYLGLDHYDAGRGYVRKAEDDEEEEEDDEVEAGRHHRHHHHHHQQQPQPQQQQERRPQFPMPPPPPQEQQQAYRLPSPPPPQPTTPRAPERYL